ncbi:YqjF family protein [Natronobiforma cellulositropha]|uniref:YqjF family protein n=1 Tax=Natronobiforma cellulositropha TaxID=1679076 RepID=UPI0021D592C9|nr:DUF2071 domain-containing protein [Natronobiforma cellulositropha]
MSRADERVERRDRDRERTAWGLKPGARRPALPHPFSMTWRDGLFLHWPADPGALEHHVPPPLELDTRDGRAWLSILPFVLARAGIRGSPGFTRLSVPELNVRTYVRFRGDPGLFFFSVDVDSALLANLVGGLSRLPVSRARMHVEGDDERVAFSSSRPGSEDEHDWTGARFAATYRPDGRVFYAEPDSLEYWLTARRRLYAPGGRGVLSAEVAHAPWPLRPAAVTVHENTMFAANGLPEPSGEALAHYCGELELTGSVPRWLRRR